MSKPINLMPPLNFRKESNLTPRLSHFMSLKALTRSNFETLFKSADDIEKNLSHYARSLSGKVLAVIFYDSSTRTRISFEAAMLRLGGAVTGFADIKTSRAAGFFGETLADTVRVMSEMVDCLIYRHKEASSKETILSHSQVPVINGGNGQDEHPTQAVLDLWMMHQHFGALDGLTIGLFGNPNWRSMNSFYYGISQFKPKKLVFLTPPGEELSEENAQYLQSNNIPWEYCNSTTSLLNQADAIESVPFYLPNFNDYNNEANSNHLSVEDRFVINRKKMQQFGKEKLLLHIGPRGKEIDTNVDTLPQAQYFTQVKKSIYMRMAILLSLIG